MNNTFYITTPIYYVNDVPHIGHAYTTVAADVLARHYRQSGYDVFFLTGVDEHGQKVQQAAAKAGIDPKLYCDGMVPRFQELWKRLNISNEAFIRTTDAGHKAIVRQYLEQLYNKKLIYEADYTGWYCTFDERFWTDKDVNQGLCPDCKRPVEQLSEKNYFFKMSLYGKELERHITQHFNPPDAYIGPGSRCNEVLGFLRKPLEDLSISRPKSRLSWGIELPFDNKYVTYVWFDALVNYISALTYLTPQSKQDPKASLQHYWRPQGSGSDIHKVVHLVGKDILTTHAVYWSTMLMALKLPLPTTIYAHGWWTVNGEKMSKSRRNVVDPNTMIDDFGVDAFRYFLLREVPFGQDGDFSRGALVNRINSELADGLGNLLSRTLTMIERFCEGRMPHVDEAVTTLGESELMQATGDLNATAKTYIEQLQFSRALEALWELFQLCDQYIEKNAPWKLAKKAEDRPKLEKVLFNVAYSIAFSIPFLYPFMPNTAYEMARQLGLKPEFRNRKLEFNKLTAGIEIVKGKPLFPRIETMTGSLALKGTAEPKLIKGETRVNEQPTLQPTSSTSTSTTPTSATAISPITIDDFMKIQLKTATVLSAERVPNSEKLIKLQVDLGTEKRQIVAGIGKKYEPDTLLGKRIVIVANLQPRKLMGIESQGMVLAAGEANVEGLITVLEDVAPGMKVK
jgi:methionyl-tRNA synthetase/methionyl-tRNA synthetase C-terminal region/beta chain